MALKFAMMIACFIATNISALPVGNTGESRYEVYTEHHLSGSSGTFRYPLSGFIYQDDERVLITASFPEDTIFIVENYDLETSYDTLKIHKWNGDDLVLDQTFTGSSTAAKYFVPEGNFLLAFESDGSITRSGFTVRWAPLETVLQQ